MEQPRATIKDLLDTLAGAHARAILAGANNGFSVTLKRRTKALRRAICEEQNVPARVAAKLPITTPLGEDSHPLFRELQEWLGPSSV